jgi:small subunit ribosomal protein S18
MAPRPTKRTKKDGGRRKYTKLAEAPRPYDVEVLGKFVTARGTIRSRAQTGLSNKQHKQVARAIKLARELALMPYVRNAPDREDGPRNKRSSR